MKTGGGELLNVPTPEQIERMTLEERKALTKKMMQQHSMFVFDEDTKKLGN
jgi:hypothetical protein